MECYWIRNTEHELEQLKESSAGVALLPLGSIESHGIHLPLGNDILNVRHILDGIISKEPVAVLPILEYSSVMEARMLPGAIHIRSDILMDYVEAICDEVYRNGFNKIVLFHGHGGNVFLQQAFVKRVMEKEKPYAVYSIPVLAGIDVSDLIESKETGHACEFDTSMSLVTHPELVHLKRLGAKTYPGREAPDTGVAQNPVEWVARHPEMAVGEPQRATREKGEEILSRWIEGAVRTLRKIKTETLTLKTMREFSRKTHSFRPLKEK